MESVNLVGIGAIAVWGVICVAILIAIVGLD